jgi:hypothetical protein
MSCWAGCAAITSSALTAGSARRWRSCAGTACPMGAPALHPAILSFLDMVRVAPAGGWRRSRSGCLDASLNLLHVTPSFINADGAVADLPRAEPGFICGHVALAGVRPVPSAIWRSCLSGNRCPRSRRGPCQGALAQLLAAGTGTVVNIAGGRITCEHERGVSWPGVVRTLARWRVIVRSRPMARPASAAIGLVAAVSRSARMTGRRGRAWMRPMFPAAPTARLIRVVAHRQIRSRVLPPRPRASAWAGGGAQVLEQVGLAG